MTTACYSPLAGVAKNGTLMACICSTAIVDVKGRENYRERGGAAAYTNVRDGSPRNED